ncbi:uncharacterized protein YxbB-like [Babylonia areolata]|uniref:uncharacterized protein YxbB-like n=1 Tax=Babylonia areolata TaxID=304850 RepID=UPI003FD33A49
MNWQPCEARHFQQQKNHTRKPLMTSKIKDSLARQLRLPTRGVWGWLTFNFLKYNSDVLEKNAARLSAIEPHHKVLEIGFGPGLGIQHALQYVKDGPGKVCGVDLSPYMVEKATTRLSAPIKEGKVELGLGNVMDIPYGTDTFHRIFHCNCYYFWPSMQDSLQEIYRVMKPGGVMVTLLNHKHIKKAQANGLLKYGDPDPLKYMCALELSGFEDVRIEYFDESSGNYQAIFAHLHVKPDVFELLENEEKELLENVNDTSRDLSQNQNEFELLEQEEKELLENVNDVSRDFNRKKHVDVSQEDSSGPHRETKK